MKHQTDSSPPEQYFLQPGYIYLPTQTTQISTVLGSCVSVCLFDRKRKVGGMARFLFPSISEEGRTTALYGNVSTITLVRMMLAEGSKRKHLEAQIIGGAYNREASVRDIGRENIRVARSILLRERISIISEDVSGRRGRKIVFNTGTNELVVMKVDRLRRSDWYPYENPR